MFKVGDTVTHDGLSAKQEKYGYPPLMGIVREVNFSRSIYDELAVQVFWLNDSGAYGTKLKKWFNPTTLKKIQ